MYDVIVIGGGPAGLQTTLTLGRMHRSTLLVDSGRYRNGSVHAMHNFVTNDGRSPADFRKLAREELAAYASVELLDTEVVSAAGIGDAFEVTAADGSTYTARKLVLATGLRDTLPDIPGVADLWGTVVAQCPFCHGHELSGQTVAVQGGPHALRLVAMLARIASKVVVAAHDHELTDTERHLLTTLGADVRDGPVTSVRPDGEGALVEVGGETVRVDGFFVAATYSQAAPFAEQLGLDLLPDGCVAVDGFARTSLSGVLAAGDLAHEASHPTSMAAVVRAAAAGQLAGAMAVGELVEAELAAAAG